MFTTSNSQKKSCFVGREGGERGGKEGKEGRKGREGREGREGTGKAANDELQTRPCLMLCRDFVIVTMGLIEHAQLIVRENRRAEGCRLCICNSGQLDFESK